MPEPLISLKNVGVSYKSGTSFFNRIPAKNALQDVTLDIFEGESIGILGKNGSGKSTLLRLLTGIIQPNSGSITTNNCSTSLLALGVGLDPFVSAKQNIVLCLLLQGHDIATAKSKIEAIGEYAELSSQLDIPVKNYSTGMRARLSFAIAIQTQSDVLLIDEILAVGDIQFRKKSSHTIKKRIASTQTIVLVSHNIKDISRLCQRCVWLENGRIREIGPTADIAANFETAI